MSPRLLAIVGALTLAARAATAQAADGRYARFSALTGWETRGYDFDPGIADLRSTSQWRVPIAAVVPFGRLVSLDMSTSYSSSTLDQGTGTKTLDGFTDTQVRTLYTIKRDRGVASLSFNLPTGRQNLDLEEFQVAGAIGSNYLAFPVPGAGAGFSATGGLAWAWPLRPWNVGLSGSFRYQGAYDPLRAPAETVTYEPGAEVRIRAGADRLLGQRGRVALGLTVSTFSTDEFVGTGQVASGRYRPGPRVIGELAVLRVIGRGTLTFVAWDYYRGAGDLNGAADDRTQENVFNTEIRWGYPASRRVQIEPSVGYRLYQVDGAAKGRLYSGAVAARFGLSGRVSAGLVGRFDSGWVGSQDGSRADLTGYGGSVFVRYAR